MPWTRRPLRLGRLRTAIIGLIALLTAAACGSGGSGGSSGDDNTITLGLPIQAATLAPVYVASDKGLWKQHNLNVKIVTFKGDSELAKAVLSGDVDIAVSALSGPITSTEAGQDVRVFFGGFNMPAFAWYSVPSVHNVADGKGKNWGVTSIGSATDLLTRFAVARAGLNPDTDIKVVQGGGSAARLAAMKAGQLQANIFTEPQTVQAQQLGYNKILDLKDLVKDYPMHVSWAKGSFVKDNKDQTKRFVDALQAGMKMVKESPETGAQSVAKELKISQQDALASINEEIDNLQPDGRMASDKSLDTYWQMGLQGKVFKKRIPNSDWLDTEFLPKNR